jgi:hypothetical protein
VTKRKYPSDKRLCECGCGTVILARDKWGNKPRFAKGHIWIGRKHKPETIAKIIEISNKPEIIAKKRAADTSIHGVRGERNIQWKGDAVGIKGLHKRIRRYLPVPDVCEQCKEKRPLDLANISRRYLTDLSDWKYLCRRCHVYMDGTIHNLDLGRNKGH